MTQVRSRSAGERNHAGSPPNKTPVSFDEAVLQVTRFAKPIGTEHVPIGDAAGRVLAAPAIAQRTAPPFPRWTAMPFAMRMFATLRHI